MAVGGGSSNSGGTGDSGGGGGSGGGGRRRTAVPRWTKAVFSGIYPADIDSDMLYVVVASQ